jgi:hypothetical protein
VVGVALSLRPPRGPPAGGRGAPRQLRRVERVVKRFERREFRLGRRMDARLRRSGMDLAAVDRYNEGIDRRFAKFKKRFRL